MNHIQRSVEHTGTGEKQGENQQVYRSFAQENFLLMSIPSRNISTMRIGITSI
ncbi:MAG: hypothetical protein IJZ70_05175 [Bacteroidales bacterium]|nr:hypothetical protein [Bacteroidales bacterium]